MKLFSYLSLLGFAALANCFDAATSYTVSTDAGTKYITLAPKTTHSKTLIYLHGGGGSATMAYDYHLKTQQIASLETKIIIANGPIAVDGGQKNGGYLWFDTLTKGTGTTDSLGNDIVAVQTGANSLDSITTTLLALIDTEKAALPGGKQEYANISVVGFSQGAATTTALLVKYNKAQPLGYMIAYAGWMPTDRTNWASSSFSVQAQIPFLALAGVYDSSFCPLSYTSFSTNLKAVIFTGANAGNLRFRTIAGVGHSITAAITTIWMSVATSITNLTGTADSANNCSTAAAATKSTKDSNCTWVENSTGKWECAAGATFLQMAVITSAASIASWSLY